MYNRVPRFLCTKVKQFESSDEYRSLNETERELPGIVAAAFTRFLFRFLVHSTSETEGTPELEVLESAFAALEQLSASVDVRVRTLVLDEVFDNIRASEDVWARFEAALGQKSKGLLKDWKERRA